MAVLTNVRRLNVCRPLTRRVSAVMAARTVTGNIDVIEIGWLPGDRTVAIITIIATGNVCRMLARCRDPIVTGRATAQYLCVVYHSRRRPHIGGMAIFADYSCQYVGRALTRCVCPVMAGTATSHHLRVIDSDHRRKGVRRMTILANVCGLHMPRTLASRISPIMAASTIVDDIYVVEKCRTKCDSTVAIVASRRARNVCLILAGCDDSVMARTTCTDHLRVIDHKRRHPNRWRMTIFANIRCLNVRNVLACRFDTVVTTGTVSNNVDVIKIGRCPRRSDVTIVASITTGNMSGIFPGCCRTVMAAYAITENVRVIEYSWQPAGRTVAIIALVTRRNVIKSFPGRLNTVVATCTTPGN